MHFFSWIFKIYVLFFIDKNNHAMLKPTLIGTPMARIKPTFSKNINNLKLKSNGYAIVYLF